MRPAEVSPKPILSTMWAPEDPAWNAVVDVLPPQKLGFSDLRAFWSQSRGRDAVILRGSVSFGDRYRDILFAMMLRLSGRRTKVVMSDAIWEPRSRAIEARLPWLSRLVPRLAKRALSLIDSRHVVYGVLSQGEVATFASQWGVAPARVAFTAFPHTLYDGLVDTPVAMGDYLFAGGDSLRDYPLLAAALRRLDSVPAVPAVVASHWVPAQPVPGLTCGWVDHEEFVHLLAGCRASVVPLQAAIRSAGQQTYLNAMALGKPVIVTDAPGVKDYVTHGATGLVVGADPAELADAIAYAMDPGNAGELTEMGQRARHWVLSHATPDHYRARLLSLALDSPATAR